MEPRKNLCSLARFCITEPEYSQIFYSNKIDTDFKTAESFERDKKKERIFNGLSNSVKTTSMF